LVGTDGGGAAIAAAAVATVSASAPISDVRGSADYRSAMAVVIARRAITGALIRARGGVVDIPASQATYGDWEPRA
jgi:CO/xanthine dehydrogenase FAD-binding subunit